jgi:amidase
MPMPAGTRNDRWTRIHGLLGAGALMIILGSCAVPRVPPPGVTRDRAFISYQPGEVDDGKLRLAVKDLIDVRGSVTTAGSEHLAKSGKPAVEDAACLMLARERGVHIVGKTNLAEFAMGTTGINEYFGTPRNPRSRWFKRVPGGSSSGSAVAVANGMADVAFGTDTAGSIRVPAACCKVYGLKTTYGLVSLKGVHPLSPDHLDTVGPMARNVDQLVEGMDLLKRGFADEYRAARAAHPTPRSLRVGRLRLDGTNAAIDEAVDAALAARGFQVVELDEAFKRQWQQAQKDGNTVALVDGWLSNRKYSRESGISIITRAAFLLGELEYPNAYHQALSRRQAWRSTLRRVFAEVDLIALPTLQSRPPRIPFLLESALFEAAMLLTQNTVAVNFAGNPAIAIPIPVPEDDELYTSLQLIGPPLGEAKLVNAARFFESKP